MAIWCKTPSGTSTESPRYFHNTRGQFEVTPWHPWQKKIMVRDKTRIKIIWYFHLWFDKTFYIKERVRVEEVLKNILEKLNSFGKKDRCWLCSS